MEKRYREGYTLRELSKIHKRTEGSLQQLFHRLRKHLRDCIEKSMAYKLIMTTRLHHLIEQHLTGKLTPSEEKELHQLLSESC